MVEPLHPPTAVVVAAFFVLVWAVLWTWRRHVARGFLSETDQLRYEVLRTASRTARSLRGGLTAEGAGKAVPHLRLLLGADAVAICDLQQLLAWSGAGPAHRDTALADAAPARESGDVEVLGRVSCPDDRCAVRAAVVAPVVIEDRVVGTLSAYSSRSSAGLVQATEHIASWVSGQVELGELDQQRTRAMEAELRSLRAQISPHFIYNSLTAIASFVRTDPVRARELLLEFADFSRYALRTAATFSTLADELRNVERYLVLEQARFGDRLQVSLQIAPEVLAVNLPYLAVQPLVENAVRHGLAGKEGVGHLSIVALDRGTEAEIVIEDDGVGSDPEHVRRALDGEFVESGDSVGLGNVEARLRQVYGDDHGLVVETAPGAGTRVTLRVPKFTAPPLADRAGPAAG